VVSGHEMRPLTRGETAPRVVNFSEKTCYSLVLDHDPFEFAAIDGLYVASP
jgi:hypothetical protein